MKCFILLLIIMSQYNLNAQLKTPNTNVWFGGIYLHKINSNTNLSGDIGYRTFNLIENRRNYFGRLFIEKIILRNTVIGLGYALFNNFSFIRNSYSFENRPFLNLQFRWNQQKHEILFRNRIEWRINENGIKNTFRKRFQIAHEYQFKAIKSRIAYELLVSNDKSNEERYTVGVLLPINNQRLNIFYAINRQSSIKLNEQLVNQHVVGINYQFSN